MRNIQRRCRAAVDRGVAVGVAGVPVPQRDGAGVDDADVRLVVLGLEGPRVGERGLDVGETRQVVERHPGRRRELDLVRVARVRGRPRATSTPSRGSRRRRCSPRRRAPAPGRTRSRTGGALRSAAASARSTPAPPRRRRARPPPRPPGRRPGGRRARSSAAPSRSAASTRPPGNTHIPPAKSRVEFRRSISVSSPGAPSRTRMTVAAGTSSEISPEFSQKRGSLFEAHGRSQAGLASRNTKNYD